MAQVILLMKSGREIATCYDWEKIKEELNANKHDTEVVVEEVCVDNNGGEYTRWTCVKKDEIEAFANI